MQTTDYHTSNYDFTFRNTLDNDNQQIKFKKNIKLNNKNKIENKYVHAWETITSPKKKIINEQSKKKIVISTNNEYNNEENDKNESDNENEIESEYSIEEAEQIVKEFAITFPKFKLKLLEQFPEEWIIGKNESDNGNNIDQTQELFQFSLIQRNEREKLINEMGLDD